jgi:hypothetical protein
MMTACDSRGVVGTRWLRVMLLIVVLLGGSAAWIGAAHAKDEHRTVLAFHTLIGVPRPFTGNANAIRGVNGGGLPWVIADAKGDLWADGDVKVKVEGLVLDPSDPDAIARGLAGVNPSPAFKVIVSCLSVDAGGEMTTVNVETAPAPATSDGDSKITGVVALPEPCIAPILFVTSPTGSWFATTGT